MAGSRGCGTSEFWMRHRGTFRIGVKPMVASPKAAFDQGAAKCAKLLLVYIVRDLLSITYDLRWLKS